MLDDATCSRRRCRPGASTTTTRGSRSRSAATTPARSASCPPCAGAEISRPFDDVVAEVERARRRGRHRGHAARPERQLLRPRPAARSAARRRRPARAAAVRRPAARRRRGRRHPPGSVHQPAPEGPAPRDDRGDGRDARRVRAPALPAAVGQRPRARARCTAATPPSATSSGSPAARAARRRPRGHHRHHRRLPRRDRRRLRAHARGRRRRREYDYAYTFIFSPRPGTEAATMADRFVAPGGRRASASSGCGSWSSAALCPARGAGRPRRGGPRRGPEQEGPRGDRRAAPGRTSSCTSPPPSPLRAGHATPTVEITARRAAPPPRHVRRACSSRRRHRTRIPVVARLTHATPPAPFAIVGPTGVGKSALAMAVAASGRRDVEIVVVDSMQVYRGMDIGTAKPTPAEQRESRITSSTSPIRGRLHGRRRSAER